MYEKDMMLYEGFYGKVVTVICPLEQRVCTLTGTLVILYEEAF
jgi:hypothetical protein